MKLPRPRNNDIYIPHSNNRGQIFCKDVSNFIIIIHHNFFFYEVYLLYIRFFIFFLVAETEFSSLAFILAQIINVFYFLVLNMPLTAIFWFHLHFKEKILNSYSLNNKVTNHKQTSRNYFVEIADLNDDHTADLFLTTKENFEVWYGKEKEGFEFGRIIPHPEGAEKIGQSLFIDVELRGRMDLVTPVCYDKTCKNSTLLVYCDGKWHNLQVNFKDLENHLWSFYHLPGSRYTNVITLHSGDFNMDGYPDILATLATSPESPPQSFLLENVACENGCGNFSRSFMVRWHALHPFKNGTVMAAFFDFYQDGILDVVLVVKNSTGAYNAAAFKNSLDYDANFIKVMVLTGLTNENNPMMMGRVGKKRRTYGT